MLYVFSYSYAYLPNIRVNIHVPPQVLYIIWSHCKHNKFRLTNLMVYTCMVFLAVKSLFITL